MQTLYLAAIRAHGPGAPDWRPPASHCDREKFSMNFVLISNIFPPHVRGGYELGCEVIARRLVALGHRVTVLTSAAVGQLDRGVAKPGLDVRAIFEPIFKYEELLDA